MHKLYGFAALSIIFVSVLLNVQYVDALGAGVVVSQVQTRSLTGGSASEELLEIYNNSDADVDVTNWCMKYGSIGSSNPTKTLACFEHSVPDAGNYVFLPKRSAAVLISKAFADKYPKFGYDLIFSSGLSDSERWVSLVDQNTLIVDMVEWGTNVASTTAEGGKEAVPPTSTQLIQRKLISPAELQDTDNNYNDFELASPRTIYNYGSVYELEDFCLNIDDIQLVVPDGYTVDNARNCSPPPVDVCDNLDGLQVESPLGYDIDEHGDCVMDICLNIDGIQQVLPDNMELDVDNNCNYHDECLNLPDIQSKIPSGYKIGANNDCLLDLLPLQITELLPNAIGVDDGNEFIEIYNPNDSDVVLENYVIYTGTNLTVYNLPTDAHIGPKKYVSFLNSDINFTLNNTSSNVKLSSSDGTIIDETPIYSNPGDGMAWALIDGAWNYTNRPTPGTPNLSSLIEVKTKEVVIVKSNLQPCAANQYRSPDTNRCRLIVVASSSAPVPCKNGQYRSEETGRCRNIATDANVLTPCAEGQERNPATNRCRSIAVAAVLGASDLAPCKAGQERNPDTNRCRNVVSSVPTAAYAPEQTYEVSNNYVLWWSLAGVGFVAVVYGVWEWRQEIVKFIHRIGSFRHLNK